MARYDRHWYVSNSRFFAIPTWAANTAYAVGDIVRGTSTQRAFMCYVAGTSHATTEPTWGTTWGAKNTDNTVSWIEVTGLHFANGDTDHCMVWDDVKNTWGGAYATVGMSCRNNAGTHVFMCYFTQGIAWPVSEPSWNTTTGAVTSYTVTGGTVYFVCLGAVGDFANWGAPLPGFWLVYPGSSAWADHTSLVTVYVASDHDCSYTSNQQWMSFGSDFQYPTFILSVDPNGSIPPTKADLQPGALERATHSSGVLGFSNNARNYIYGVEFRCEGAGTAYLLDSSNGIRDNCTFSTTSGSKTGWGWSLGGYNVYQECTFRFGVVGDSINNTPSTKVYDRCVFADSGAVPTNIFYQGSAAYYGLYIYGSDFSAFGSGKSIVNQQNPIYFAGALEKCVLNDARTEAPASEIYWSRFCALEYLHCDTSSANTNYNYKSVTYVGTLTTETTCVRTGGASDGVTSYAWKIVNNSNASHLQFFACPPIIVWNETVGVPVTVDVYGYWSGAAVPTNMEIFMEVEYYSASGSTLGALASNARATPLTAATSHNADTSTWGAGGTTKFKMSVTFTPQKKGPLAIYVYPSKASATFYIDPQAIIS